MLQVTDLHGVGALLRPARRQVGLERDLHDHRARRSRCLAQQRHVVGHVLEYVLEVVEVLAAICRG